VAKLKERAQLMVGAARRLILGDGRRILGEESTEEDQGDDIRGHLLVQEQSIERARLQAH
jgi:hypothetical protein